MYFVMAERKVAEAKAAMETLRQKVSDLRNKNLAHKAARDRLSRDEASKLNIRAE